ncbi:MAG: J domain-containing protein [Bacteroidota bacterium]
MLFDKLKNLIRSRLLTKDKLEEDTDAYIHWESEEAEPEPNQDKQYTQAKTGRFNAKEAGYYANLELKEGASFVDIKAAYKRLVKKYHPDKFHNDEQKRKYAEQITQKLNEAYRYFEEKHGQK